MGKSEVYILIAVFVLLTVILVWLGAKSIMDIRNRKRRQEQHRREWQEKISNMRQGNN